MILTGFPGAVTRGHEQRAGGRVAVQDTKARRVPQSARFAACALPIAVFSCDWEQTEFAIEQVHAWGSWGLNVVPKAQPSPFPAVN